MDLPALSIKNLTKLKNELKSLDWVDDVITILDVPLLKNNDDPLAERIKNFAKKPAKGGIPASEKKNTSILIDLEFDVNLKPLS